MGAEIRNLLSNQSLSNKCFLMSHLDIWMIGPYNAKNKYTHLIMVLLVGDASTHKYLSSAHEARSKISLLSIRVNLWQTDFRQTRLIKSYLKCRPGFHISLMLFKWIRLRTCKIRSSNSQMGMLISTFQSCNRGCFTPTTMLNTIAI